MRSLFNASNAVIEKYIGPSYDKLSSLYDNLGNILPYLSNLSTAASSQLKLVTPHHVYTAKNNTFIYTPVVIGGIKDGTLSYSLSVEPRTGIDLSGWGINSNTGQISKSILGADIGQTVLHITATDSVGTDTVTMVVNTVHILDNQNQIVNVSLIGNRYISLELGTPFVDPGYNTNLTPDSVNVINNVDHNTAGDYLVTYEITKDGITVYDYRVVHIVPIPDVLPSITILGNNPVYLNKNDIYVDDGATFTDAASNSTSGDTIPDTSSNGVHFVTYTAVGTDPNLTVTAVRTVVVLDCSGAAITIPPYNYNIVDTTIVNLNSFIITDY